MALLVGGWVLLTAAWVVGNQPLAAPDEADHYVKTVGIAEGEFLGRAAPEARIGATERQIASTRQITRAILVPTGLNPPSCEYGNPRRPLACAPQAEPAPAVERVTPVGTYQPLPYLAPAALVRAGDEYGHAVRWARAAGALAALLFLALAVALLTAPGRVESVLGAAVAVTPMVLFISGSLNPSGLEIASGLAFLAGLLRVSRAEPPPAWVWLATGLAGAVLAASRSPGPIWVLFGLAVALALLGRGAVRRRVREGGRTVWVAGALIAAGVIANRIWEAAHGPETPVATFALRDGLELGLDQLWMAAPDLVGKFGYREYALPLWIPLTWATIVVVLGLLAWRASGTRERRVLAAVAVAGVALPYLLWVLSIRDTGFGLQGRHVIAIIAAVPLLAGELLHRSSRRLPAAGVAATTAILGLVHVAAFYLNGRRYAVGTDGPTWFVGDAVWSPPLGWWPILVLAAAGGLAVAASGLPARRPASLSS